MHGIGVIGCGVWGCHSLERALLKQPGTRVVALTAGEQWGAHCHSEGAIAAGRRYATELGAEWRDDWQSVVDDPRVSILSLMTSPAARRKPALRAFAAGKHVVVDKPLAATLEDATTIARAEAASDGIGFMLCGHHTRPAVERLKGTIDSGRIGTLRSLSVRLFFTGGILPGFKPTPTWLAGTSGGEMTTVGTHALMTTRYLTGSTRPASVIARTANLFYPEYERIGAEDWAEIGLRWADGLVATVTCGRLPVRTGGEIFSVEAVGTDGLATVHGALLTILSNGMDPEEYDFTAESGPERVMGETFRRFLATVEGRAAGPPTTFADGLAIQELLHTAYTRADEGSTIPLEGR